MLLICSRVGRYGTNGPEGSTTYYLPRQIPAIFASQTAMYVWVLYRGWLGFVLQSTAMQFRVRLSLDSCVLYSSWQTIAMKSLWKVASSSLQPLRSMLQLTHSPILTKGSHRQHIYEGTWSTYFSKTSLRFRFHTVSHHEIYSLGFFQLFEHIKVTQHLCLI